MSELRSRTLNLILDFVLITLALWLMITMLMSACAFLAVLWYALSHTADIAGCLPGAT